MNELVKLNTITGLPERADPALVRAVDYLHSRLEHGDLPDDCGAALEAGRAAMERRRAELSASLAQRDRRAVAAAVARLLGAFRQAAVGQDDAAETVASYTAVVEQHPVWAVRAAVDAYLSGSVQRENHRFAPTVAELNIEIAKRVRPYQTEQSRIGRVLNARILPPVERPSYEELKARYGPNWGIETPPEETEINEARKAFRARLAADAAVNRERACIAKGFDPKWGCSPELLKSMGITPTAREAAE